MDITTDYNAHEYLTPSVRWKILGKWYNGTVATVRNPIGDPVKISFDALRRKYPDLFPRRRASRAPPTEKEPSIKVDEDTKEGPAIKEDESDYSSTTMKPSTDARLTAGLMMKTESDDAPATKMERPARRAPVQPKPEGIATWSIEASSFADMTYFRGVNWQELKERLHYPSNTAIRLQATINSNLPTGIDLTTADILTFYPGYLRDPSFIYRCISVGWTARSIYALLQNNRPHSMEGVGADVMDRTVEVVMRKLTGDKKWKWSHYQKHMPVAARSNFGDYTSSMMFTTRALAEMPVVRQVWPEDIEDPHLSQLWAYANGSTPTLEDGGTLTRLILVWSRGEITDMRESQISDFLLLPETERFVVDWSADEDGQSAARWKQKVDDQNAAARRSSTVKRAERARAAANAYQPMD